MSDVVLDSAQESGLLQPGTAYVVMLSGGQDSVCLLDVMVRLLGSDELVALHLNYGLRAAADEDQLHCAALCERLGVEFRAIRAEPKLESGNVQDWARELRYAAAYDLAQQRNALIAVAHTATDRVETVLYRLAASPGRRALLAMRAREGSVVRPLLGVTRAQTAAYCAECGLEYRADESNLSDLYVRNRIRAELLPLLERLHPAATENVLRTVDELTQESEVLDQLVDAVIAGRGELEVTELLEQPPALRRLVVRELAERTLGRPVSSAYRRAEEILELGARDRGKRELHIEGEAVAVLERGVLSFRELK